jgi:hypothetical protein
MKTITINRFFQNEQKTLGEMNCTNGVDIMFKTLELPCNENKRSISCIPADTYEAVPIIRPNGDWALHIQNVPNRTAILIHKGNYTRDIRGCILPGFEHLDIDKDGITDVTQSGRAMNLLKSWVGTSKKVKVIIIDGFKMTCNDPKDEKRV